MKFLRAMRAAERRGSRPWAALLRGLAGTALILFGCSPNPAATAGRAGAWHTPTAASLSSFWLGRPAVDNGRVFVEDGNKAMALDGETGAILWARPVRIAPAPPLTVLLARDGRLYVSEVDSVLAIDETSGATIWNFRPSAQALAAPALDDSTLYAGDRGGTNVYAIELANGRPRWTAAVGAGAPYWFQVGGLSVSGDTVYATATLAWNPNGVITDGLVIALDRSSGRELWRIETDSGGRHSYLAEPLVSGRMLIVNDVTGPALVGIDRFSRQEVWRDTTVRAPSQTTVRDGTVYTAGSNGNAAAIDAATGAVKWKSYAGSSAMGAALCGQVFVVNTEFLRTYSAVSGAFGAQLAGGYHDVLTSEVATDGRRAWVTGETGVFSVKCG